MPEKARGERQSSVLPAAKASTLRSRYQQLCDEAITQLQQAREIYADAGSLLAELGR